MLLYLSEPSPLRALAGGLGLLCIEGSDVLDGFLARRWNVSREIGALLDPLADSLSRIVIYGSLASEHLVLFAVPLVMALRDIAVSYARHVLILRGLSASARVSGKIKAIVQAFGAFLAFLIPAVSVESADRSASAVSWIVMVVTALSSLEYIRDAVRALKSR